MEGRGYGRVDFRMDAEGNFYVLEVNPNPDLGAGLKHMAQAHGWEFPQLIEQIIAEAQA